MNTQCDTAPNKPQKINFETKQFSLAQPCQVYRRILVGTDFSDASACAFEQALKLAKQNNAELLVAHSSTTPGWIGFMPTESFGNWDINRKTEAEKGIGALIQEARTEGVSVHMLLLEGVADDALIAASKRLGVDLIVIGMHGRRGVSRFFTGNVAAHVVFRAPCAVLTVHSSDSIEGTKGDIHEN